MAGDVVGVVCVVSGLAVDNGGETVDTFAVETLAVDAFDVVVDPVGGVGVIVCDVTLLHEHGGQVIDDEIVVVDCVVVGRVGGVPVPVYGVVVVVVEYLSISFT